MQSKKGGEPRRTRQKKNGQGIQKTENIILVEGGKNCRRSSRGGIIMEKKGKDAIGLQKGEIKRQ